MNLNWFLTWGGKGRRRIISYSSDSDEEQDSPVYPPDAPANSPVLTPQGYGTPLDLPVNIELSDTERAITRERTNSSTSSSEDGPVAHEIRADVHHQAASSDAPAPAFSGISFSEGKVNTKYGHWWLVGRFSK